MKSLSLKAKLLLSFMIAGIVPMLAVGFYSNYKAKQALLHEAENKLLAIKATKSDIVQNYFKTIEDQVAALAQGTMIESATYKFLSAYDNYLDEKELSDSDLQNYRKRLRSFYKNEFKTKYDKENKGSDSSVDPRSLVSSLSDTQVALQYAYIANNPNALGSKELLESANDKTTYSKTHKRYHPGITAFLKQFGFYDIFIINNSGDIIYSVYKEVDYATSLKNGSFRNTNLAKVYNDAKNLGKGEYALVDYKLYEPSYNAPASFVASPIYKDGKKMGVLAFQMPITRLNKLMATRSGMGKTGEAYLIGTDGLMRSDTFLDKENHNVKDSYRHPEKHKLKTFVAEEIKKHKTGVTITENYFGTEVLSSYKPIDIMNLRWGLVVEVSTEEEFAEVNAAQRTLYFVFAICGAFVLGLALFMSKVVMLDLVRRIKSVSGKLIASVSGVTKASDDILNQSVQLSEATSDQASSLQETVCSIDEISSMVQKNADAAESSTKVSEKSNATAAEGKKTIEEMIESINDIASSNEDIMNEIEQNNQDLTKIIDVISNIGEKTKVINDIVFQTKLLSFNASVEAARAGEHGKGFAVVAEEVGNLASMSGKAALEITEMLDDSIKQVTDLVSSTKKKVEGLVVTGKEKVNSGTRTAHRCEESLDEILKNVVSVNEMVREISTASSEQAVGVKEVTKAMQLLDQTTHQNSSIAKESSEMAKDLKGYADELNLAIKELMNVVGDTSYDEDNNDSDQANNTIPLKRNISLVKDEPANDGLKVSGMSATIPSATDPRFEDL